MKQIFYIIISIFAIQLQAQTDSSEYIGTYGDWMLNGKALTTELELKKDGTFELRSVDNIYPRTFKDFTNKGTWIAKDDEVILNPTLKKRKPLVKITEKKIGLNDSIEVKVNHYNEYYENGKLIEKKKTAFEILTVYFNKKRKYKHLTREWYDTGSCAWAPIIRNRINLDSTNTFRIAKRDIENIGVYTYGFTDFIEIPTEDKNSDHYEIEVTVPLDRERMPRSKKVIIKGRRAYFYESKGKVKKSLNPLYKKLDKGPK
ncbi:hypothetical protein ACFQ1M_17610 [Sungkyunkwania multivorans]|uniref:DUF3108 domain-containing protein n=1 Tax=Sungkyunkwania multivorans TaxID=1173618 RepID=A0ABW3D413_9FLAO